MIIEVTQTCETIEAAEDQLAGLGIQQNTLVAYIRLPRTKAQKIELVSIHACEEGSLVERERKVLKLYSYTTRLLNAPMY